MHHTARGDRSRYVSVESLFPRDVPARSIWSSQVASNLHACGRKRTCMQPYNVRCMKRALRVLQVSRRAQEGWEEQCHGPWSISGCCRPRSSSDLWQILSSPRRRTPPGAVTHLRLTTRCSLERVGFKRAQAACDNARRALLRVGAADGADGRTPVTSS